MQRQRAPSLPRRTHEAYGPVMRFQILGPLEVARERAPVPLGGPKQRAVLAHLIVRANHVVTADELIDRVWGDEPPESARNVLQTYISHLRGALGSERVEGRTPGYVLHLEPGELDAMLFEDLVREARKANGQSDRSASLLREALELWRGAAFADLATEESLAGEIARLNDLHLQALEERIGADIACGRHADILGEVEALTHEYRLRERLWGHLIIALYRSGRQTDALTRYQRLREILADELGVDPSPELQRLHERILQQDPDLELKGKALRGYRLLEPIGEGAFGVVYRATQPQIGREVAIKAIHPELANHPDFVRRFEREAQIVARLEHPHIVPLYDYWREPDGAFLVMRFLRGGSVEDLIAEGPLSVERAATLLDQIAAALAAAHRQGVVHRDVKPGNVLLDEEGNAYLTDFGVALDAGSPERTSGTMMRGTPAYLSPEQVRLESATPQSDVYALGVVLYEMLTGEHPFPEGSLSALLDRHLREPVPSLRDARPELPREVDQVIARATAKDAEDRFGDVLEVAAAYRVVVSAAGVGAPDPVSEIRNPYKGLRAFLEADAGDFFGRESVARRLVDRLSEPVEGARFLAVVGPSGSGKSSVVQAGLVPALRRGALPGSERWFVVDVLPGAHPFRELESALLTVAVEPPPSLLEELLSDELGLVRAADRLLPDPDAELVIVLDQFEEVFTLMPEGRERLHLLASLRAAALQPESRVRVVATLRADFFDEPLAIHGFGDLLAARTEAIPPMSPEELERAIVAPADRSGLAVEPRLLAAMIPDVVDRPGALPLLQYALTELAERRTDGVLTLEGYRRLGGVSGALARRAEQLLEAMNDTARDACRQMFLRLVTLGEGSDDTRRRVWRSELIPLAAPSVMAGVIDAFGRHRLLSFDRDPSTREPTVEIAHEALLAVWARLHTWIGEARDDIRTERQLSTAAREWLTSEEDESFLLHGTRLEQISTWASTTTIGLSPTDETFLRASITRRNEEIAREQARKDRETATLRRSTNRLRLLVAVFAVAALVAGSLTVIARNQSIRAERESRMATARELAAAVIANLEVDPERSILLALEAVRTTRSVDGTVLREAEEALHRAVQASRIDIRLNVPAAEVEFSPDGSLLATVGNPEASVGSPATRVEQEAFVWDTKTGERVLTLSGHSDHVWDVHFSPDGSRLATASEDGTAAIWDAETGERLLVLPGHAPGYLFSNFSSDGTRLLTTDAAGDVRVWDARDGDLELRFSSGARPVCAGGFSPDGTLIAAGTCGDPPWIGIVWDAETGDRVLTLRGHHQEIVDVAFSPDGSRIATASLDGTAKLWDASTGRRLLTLAGHGGWVLGVDFSPDGKLLATAGIDGTARLWDMATGRDELVLSGHTGLIGDVDFNPDGQRLATGSGDGTVRIWDVGPQGSREQATVALPAAVQSVAYSPDGTWLATSSLDGRARIWDASTGRRIRTFSGADASLEASFSPDGGTLATVGRSGPPILWDLASGDKLRSLSGAEGLILGVSFSPDGTMIAAGTGPTQRGTGQVLVWDASTGHLIEKLGELGPDTDHSITNLAFSPDSRLLAAASWDGHTRVWDVASGEERMDIPTRGFAIEVAFSPDGRLLGTANSGGTVTIWDVSNGTQLRSLTGHLGAVLGVAFSPNGEFLATAGEDNTTRLWNVASGRESLVLAGETLGLTDATFSPDGTRLAASSNDGTVRVYVLPIRELIDLARSRLTRGWTEGECQQYLHTESCPLAS
jgi:WD40 repeat protein/DNA-binding SARP family transcriptional activator